MLTGTERALMQHVFMHGSEGYPIVKRGRSWWIREWRDWAGFPSPFKTKREAEAQFRRWLDLKIEESGLEAQERALANSKQRENGNA